jgi:hypothetical protein
MGLPIEAQVIARPRVSAQREVRHSSPVWSGFALDGNLRNVTI